MTSDSDPTTARDILRLARRRQRLTQAELAERAGVSQTVIARYESRRPGPIGRRLVGELDTVFAALDALGATDAHIHGGVADGSEGVGCPVLIGVCLPPDVDVVSVMAAAGRIGLAIGARVTIVPHARVADYGFDDEGVPLTPLRRAS